MNNVVVTLKFKCLENLYCKSADQSSWDTLEVILFDEFIKIHTKQFKWEQQVLSEYSVVVNSYNIVLIILVFDFKISQQMQLNTCLVLEALLIADYFNGHYSLQLVIIALQGLTEATRA